MNNKARNESFRDATHLQAMKGGWLGPDYYWRFERGGEGREVLVKVEGEPVIHNDRDRYTQQFIQIFTSHYKSWYHIILSNITHLIYDLKSISIKKDYYFKYFRDILGEKLCLWKPADVPTNYTYRAVLLLIKYKTKCPCPWLTFYSGTYPVTSVISMDRTMEA